jgi:hypothetical protein
LHDVSLGKWIGSRAFIAECGSRWQGRRLAGHAGTAGEGKTLGKDQNKHLGLMQKPRFIGGSVQGAIKAALRGLAVVLLVACTPLYTNHGFVPDDIDLAGITTGVDVFKLTDVAEERVVPLMDHPIRIDRDSLVLGYAGVYSSFLLFAKRAQVKYGIPSHELLLEMGRMKTVGGQEDMIEDTAMTMARERKQQSLLTAA